MDMTKRKRTRSTPPEEPRESREDRRYRILKESLRFDKDNLDDDLVEHPELVNEAGREFAFAISARDAQEEHMRRIRGRISEEARARFKHRKPTVEDLKLAVYEDPDYQKEKDKLLALEEQVRLWESLKQSYDSRGFAMHNATTILVARMKAEGGQSYKDSEDDTPRRGRDGYR